MLKNSIFVLVMLSCIFMVNNAFAYSSQAAPRPGTGVPSNSGPPVVCGGWDCDDSNTEPTPQPRYDTGRFTIHAHSQYEHSVKEASTKLADWYLNSAGPANRMYNTQRVNAALNDARNHPNYYKKCLTYGLYRGTSTIASYYDAFQGVQLSRYLKDFSDGVIVGCYDRR